MTRNRIWETLALLLVAFTLFRPGFWWDLIYEPINVVPASRIVEMAEKVPPEGDLRMQIAGENIDGDYVKKTIRLPLGVAAPGAQRLSNIGLETRIEEDRVIADNVMFGSVAQQAGLDFDWEILNLQVAADRPPKQLMFIPALLLLGFVALMQRRRRPSVVSQTA